MSWTNATPVPQRQPGETIRDIPFRHELDGQNQKTNTIVGRFYHRDGRLWQARIVHAPSNVEDWRFENDSWILTMSSGGCRNYQFLSANIGSAKKTALRFANIPLENYQRLVADAHGTTDFPRPSIYGIFQVKVVQNNATEAGVVETQSYSLRGIGRIDNGTIVIFPLAAELEQIFDPVCDNDTVSLIPVDINRVSNTPGIQQALEEIEEDMQQFDVDEILSRNFADTPEDAVRNFNNGATFRQREERVIDIGDD